MLDSNTIILLSRLGPGTPMPRQALASTITFAELCVGPVVATDPAVVAIRQSEVNLAEKSFELLPFDVASARTYAGVVASLRAAGRKGASRTTDAMIAAVAIANGLPLYTCNPADFAGIDGLEVVPIPHPNTP
ncbi:MAG TPA: type II toxin-antitoxin system VapC family toxin [Egibacteraceae bacterium]|nr:type II toxin-antitoxin system VapC family toxin [Egibacteraceae bacterium]